MVAVGRSVPRREDRPLLQGRGRFLDDLAVDGVLHARFVRSPVAHAVVRGITVPDAARGLVAVFTAADLGLAPMVPPIDNPDAAPVPRPVLASDRIRFAGEPFALVVATDPYLAEDVAELVDLDVQVLPTVTDPIAAMDVNSPLVHEHPSNVLFERHFTSPGFADEVAATGADPPDARLASADCPADRAEGDPREARERRAGGVGVHAEPAHARDGDRRGTRPRPGPGPGDRP